MLVYGFDEFFFFKIHQISAFGKFRIDGISVHRNNVRNVFPFYSCTKVLPRISRRKNFDFIPIFCFRTEFLSQILKHIFFS